MDRPLRVTTQRYRARDRWGVQLELGLEGETDRRGDIAGKVP